MTLLVPFSESLHSKNTIEKLSLEGDSLAKNPIAINPWPAYDYKPKVHFAIGYGHDCILLKYYVVEKDIRAIYYNSNDPVHKDSCVEFFISFGNEKQYYNFEFNCVGTCKLAYGVNRFDRESLPEVVIRKINKQSVITSLINLLEESVSWTLTLMVPFDVFYYHSFRSLKNVECKANFYKCGDDLPQPHFLVWNDIKSERPDFHLSEYFGKMKFL